MKHLGKKIFYISFLSIFFTLPFIINAQFIPGADNGFLSVVPEIPEPNSNITLNFVSYSFDLKVADINWFVNGNEYQKGKGLTSIQLKIGDVGSVTNIRVLAVSREGYPLQQELTLRPAKVDVLYEAETYTPPFYKGKPLYSYQGRVRVVAIPYLVNENGVRLKNNEIVFNWRERGNIVSARSGLGKNVYNFTGKVIARSNELEVEASSIDGKISALTTVNMTPIEPKVLMYEKDPLYGFMFNKAVKENYSLSKDEATFSAFPFFFNALTRDDSRLSFKWTLNGGAINSGQDVGDIIIRRPLGSSGRSNLALALSNTVEFFQYGEKNIMVSFGGALRDGLFR